MPGFTAAETVTYNGNARQRTLAIQGDNEAASSPVGGIAAAQSGVLTTRSSASAGDITMDDGGHTVTTGARVSLFWAGGSRHNVTVGTVSGTTVPVSGGSGDNLPIATTAINVSIPDVEAIAVTGDNAVGLFVYADYAVGQAFNSYVEYLDSGNAVLAAYRLTSLASSDSWDGPAVATNPLAGVVVAKVAFSQGNLSALVMGETVIYN